jgi:CheY-like chemotaxis protein
MTPPAQKAVPVPPPTKDVSAFPQIMLADDSHTTREIIKQILEEEFDVLEFDNGVSAWERIEGGSDAKAIITDIDMPGMDGVELISRIRKSADPKIRDLPRNRHYRRR